MKKNDILKIVSLLMAADAVAQKNDTWKIAGEANAASLVQNSSSSCFGAANQVVGNFDYTTNTVYDFRVRRVDGSVENFVAGTVLKKGDEIFVRQNNTADWSVQVTSFDLPQPPVIPETTTACTTAVTTAYTTDMTTMTTDSGTTSGGDDDDDDGPCFSEETEILMGDGSKKAIKNVVAGDKVKSYDQASGEIKTSVVTMMCSAYREGMYVVGLEDGTELNITLEHPLYFKTEAGTPSWGVIDLNYYMNIGIAKHLEKVEQLNAGDYVMNSNLDWVKIKSIKKNDGKAKTVNIRKAEGFDSFFAGGVLASTYEK